jgi:hypothetical protein
MAMISQGNTWNHPTKEDMHKFILRYADRFSNAENLREIVFSLHYAELRKLYKSMRNRLEIMDKEVTQ